MPRLLGRIRWEFQKVISKEDLRDLEIRSPSVFEAVRASFLRQQTTAEKAVLDKLKSFRRRMRWSRDKLLLTDGRPAPKLIPGWRLYWWSIPDFWGQMLFMLARNLRTTKVLELGTCVGISTAYQASALTMNQKGTLVSLECEEGLAAVARRNLAFLGLDRVTVVVGDIRDTLSSVLVDHGPVDFAYFDADHKEDRTVRFFTQLLPYLSPGAVLVFDDIHLSSGMTRAWTAIRHNPVIASSVDLFRLGICVLK